ncbi:hypothetical protein J3R82DRAFT_2920 [Butyriboletus roseoflavus]|nr:hypothetical protein J3R82DRAFT_2920 [Butyriboletus roseoflavus]
MSSLPNIDLSGSGAECANRHDSNSNMPPPSFGEHDTASQFRLTSGQNHELTGPATGSTSHQLSENSERTMLGGFYDGVMFDNTSSVTLQDEFPWHEVGVNKCMQKIPSTIVPALLQGVSDVSPSRSSLDGVDGESCEVKEDSSDSGDLPRYSAAQKRKWIARKDDNVVHGSHWVGSPRPFDSFYNPVEDWVIHNRPILQDYADRQTSLPLGCRLEVSIDEPPQFILGAIQLLVNRDREDYTERSRQLGPRLIENFVDIDRWAKEYFRSRHGTQLVDSDVSTLLTIVMNNFYEGQVQLIDRLVEFALQNMRFCGRSNLSVEDFAFGFDFKMSQDLPFYVETGSQIREPLPIRAVEVPSAPKPVVTSSGRQVKPTERAQAASEQAKINAGGRRNKGINTSQVKDKQATNGAVPGGRQKNNSAQPSCNPTVSETSPSSQADPRVAVPAPPKTTSKHAKHGPIRPSTLALPPISPGSSSTPGNTHLRSDGSSKSKQRASASADSPKIIRSSGSNPAVRSSLRLKIKPPALSSPASTVPATNDSGSALNNTNASSSQTITPAGATSEGCGASRSRGTRARHPSNWRGRGHGHERGDASLTLRAETREVIPDNTKVQPTARPVCSGNVAAVNLPMVHPTLVDVLRSTVGTKSGSRSRGTDDSIGVRDDDGPSLSRSMKPLLLPNDPDHPQGKKRRVGDCEGQKNSVVSPSLGLGNSPHPFLPKELSG